MTCHSCGKSYVIEAAQSELDVMTLDGDVCPACYRGMNLLDGIAIVLIGGGAISLVACLGWFFVTFSGGWPLLGLGLLSLVGMACGGGVLNHSFEKYPKG